MNRLNDANSLVEKKMHSATFLILKIVFYLNFSVQKRVENFSFSQLVAFFLQTRMPLLYFAKLSLLFQLMSAIVVDLLLSTVHLMNEL